MKTMTLFPALLLGSMLSSSAFASRNDINPLQRDAGDSYTAVKPVPSVVDADSDMQRVLSALSSLNGKSLPGLTPEEARKQPSFADAVKVVEKQENIPAPNFDVTTKEIAIPVGNNVSVAGRVYFPPQTDQLKSSPLPVIVYYHGGGWVIATNDTYDATPRAMADLTQAIVVSVEYRKAPEHKFPTAWEDSFAAYKWVLANAASWGGDPKRVAVMGESAGGNLAINVSIAARNNGIEQPIYQVLVYPVAGVDMNTKSYIENEHAKPLDKATVKWMVKNTIRSDADLKDPRLDLVGKADIHGLPATTVITAQIDPLRSEGIALAEKLKAAGIPVDAKTFDGVTHEFFGMGAVVKKANEAENMAAADLNTAFHTPVGTAPAMSEQHTEGGN